jgi:hypothetical protein
MNIALWIVQGILGLAFILLGSMKAFHLGKAIAGLSWGLVTFIGIAELLGGLGLILPKATGVAPFLTPVAAIALGVIMILAAGFHIKRKENFGMTIIFLALLIFVAIGRF